MPSYNRPTVLPRAVGAIFRQQKAPSYEVIIVDDGSNEATKKVLQKLKKKFPLRLLEQENAGPAAARNRGIAAARGKILLFIQDDIIAAPNFLAAHGEFHRRYPQQQYAAVGFTTWADYLTVTPFMHWLEHGGPQFDYDRLRAGEEADHLAFYTSNLSLKRAFVWPDSLMDETLFTASGISGYEDTEWGWRLQKKGLRLYYWPTAQAGHDHPQTLAQVCRRRYFLGRLSHLLFQRHPDFSWQGKRETWRYRWRYGKSGFLGEKWRYYLSFWLNCPGLMPFLRWLAEKAEKRYYWPLLYKLVCAYYYRRGRSEGPPAARLAEK